MRKNSHRTAKQEYNYPDNSQKFCFVYFANHMPPVSNFKFNFYNKQFFQIPLLHTILLHNNTIKQIIQLPFAWHSHYYCVSAVFYLIHYIEFRVFLYTIAYVVPFSQYFIRYKLIIYNTHLIIIIRYEYEMTIFCPLS